MKKIVLILSALGLSFAALASPQTFDFKDPKGVNNVVFRTDAPIESINGTATGVSGLVTFDPADPGSVKGKIVVDAASLHVPNSMMQGHLQGPMWLDVTNFPNITFETVSVENAKTDGNTTIADVIGDMTIKGVTQKTVVRVKLTYLKDRLKDRSPTKQEGDLLVLRGNFIVKRSDYGINKGKMENKVSDEIELNFAIAGQCPSTPKAP